MARTSLGTQDVASLSTEQIMEMTAESSRRMAAEAARILLLTAELDRREGWREEGATSLESWIVERCGVSVATARAWAQVSERISDLPHLAAALSAGDVTFDKVRVVAGAATPENDRDLSAQATQCSVRELADLQRRAPNHPASARAEADQAVRSVRFNDTFRTVTAQLPPEGYAEVKACLEARAREIPSDGETPWDQRLCDGFLQVIRASGRRGEGGNPYFVVAHVPLAALVDQDGAATDLAGDLERGELVSRETVRRITCDATITIAVDDDAGHTMYEGRARRDPTGAQRREVMRRDRHCRFPGCTNVTFTDVHHIVPWKPDGRTDLDNLALLCHHHHRRVHSKDWTMSGNANEELGFVGPTGRVMVSRPSPLWTGISVTG
jgi:hypothetical protein